LAKEIPDHNGLPEHLQCQYLSGRTTVHPTTCDTLYPMPAQHQLG
jgi:hypothetical protein